MGIRAAGFSLIELMVAITLGILLSIGIVTLFGATSTTNKVQDALARLQENGRYALTRITDDLRMGSGQYCGSSSSHGWTDPGGTDGPIYPGLTILSNANGVSIGCEWLFPGQWRTARRAVPRRDQPIRSVRPISCRAMTARSAADVRRRCRPVRHLNGLPDEGQGDGLRVRGADVLTLRYQRGSAGISRSTRLHRRR